MYCHCDTGNHYFDKDNQYCKKNGKLWFKPQKLSKNWTFATPWAKHFNNSHIILPTGL